MARVLDGRRRKAAFFIRKSNTNMPYVTVAGLRAQAPDSLDGCSPQQLWALADLALRGYSRAAIELGWGLALCGWRMVGRTHDGRYRLARGWRRVLASPFDLHNARTLAGIAFNADGRLGAHLTTSPLRGLTGAVAWGDGLDDVELEEWLLAGSLLARLGNLGVAELGSPEVSALLGVVCRRPDPRNPGRRIPLAAETDAQRTAFVAAKLTLAQRLCALWYLQGTGAMLARRFPRLFSAAGTEGRDAPYRLLYAMCQGRAADLPQIKGTLVWDALLLLEEGVGD